MAKSTLVIHKFGGTSVADSSRYQKVAQLLDTESGEKKIVVVSAMSGVTDQLISLADLAKIQDPSWNQRLSNLKQKHFETVDALLAEPLKKQLKTGIDADCQNITDVLKAVSVGKNYSESNLEFIAGHGEIWSAQILNGLLLNLKKSSTWIDARKILIVSPGETGPVVDWDVSKKKYLDWKKSDDKVLTVVTGYVASTPEGVPTTLKRNGSDFSASIFARLSDASEIVIWTDVDGVLSADPRKVPEAVVLTEMSYSEAVELAYFGAKVIHPHTMAPALKMKIPIWIRNTFNPKHPGTKIHGGPRFSKSLSPVKGFSTIDNVVLINLEGTSMIGVPGVANRLFGALKEVGVSVIMISQASSEHSICCMVPAAQGTLAHETVKRAFYSELQQGQIQDVSLIANVSILAAVGDQMVEVPGVAATFFGALGKAGINIRAIAQGSSERNISVVVDQTHTTRALRAVHGGFYLSNQTLSVGIIGRGLIGSALLDQLQSQIPVLNSQFKIDLRVRGIMNSSQMLISDKPIDLKNWKNEIEKAGTATNISEFVRHVKSEYIPHSVIVDCTASDEISQKYGEWLKQGVHVVTPNKKANSGDYSYYQSIREICRTKHSHFLYEANVGAGLPVMTTLRDLIQTGDKVLKIEGVLSGTLSFLFNSLGEKVHFSDVVRDAKKRGYTEPDPRDDLSGKDFARKLIILARELGLPLELENVEVESLVPAALREGISVDEFLSKLSAFDGDMEKKYRAAEQKNEVLRYVGVITAEGKSSVSLKTYPKDHAFARIKGTDNIIAFTTNRYLHQSLIVQGPGAGPEVTAGGVFADLLRLSSYIAGTNNL